MKIASGSGKGIFYNRDLCTFSNICQEILNIIAKFSIISYLKPASNDQDFKAKKN